MLEGRPGVCAEVESGGGRDDEVGCASFEVATGSDVPWDNFQEADRDSNLELGQ